MKYSKYEMGPYNLHIINTDKFKTVTIKIHFKRELIKKEITCRNLLSDILMESSQKYHTKKLLEIQKEELYGIKVWSGINFSGNYSILSFNSNFLAEQYAEGGMLDKSIAFLSELIFNPKINNNQFDEEIFKITKNNLRDDIISFKDNPRNHSLSRMVELMDSKSSLSYHPYGYIKDLEQIDASKLYKYYQSVIKSDIVDIFIIGDLDNNKVKKTIMNHFTINTLKKPSGSHFITHEKFRKRARIVKEQKDVSQSYLVLGYKLNNLTDFEKNYVSLIYSLILGGGADSKLFRIVREKHSLCYFISSSIPIIENLLIIRAEINKKTYDKAVKLIRSK